MKVRFALLPSWFKFAAASLVLLPIAPLCAQNTPAKLTPDTAAPASPSPAARPAPAKGESAATEANRAIAYYHVALATIDEEEAVESERPDLINRAIDEYKTALNAEPDSPELNDGLADLYFSSGRTQEAEVTARALLKIAPNDIGAHELLGKIYLRELSDASNSVSSTSPSGNVLDQAIAEFETIVALQPKSVEDRMVLGQLYTVKHEPRKAEDEFKTAETMEPDSEEVVLNLARLYAESGDLKQAIKVIEAVPVDDRSPKMEVALGASYEQLKQMKDAIAAYQRASDMDPSDAHTLSLLADALLNDNQLDAALKEFKLLLKADPDNAETYVHIGEILRRQGKFEDALAAIRIALTKDPTSLEAGYNEGMLLDVLGRFDDAAQTYQKMVDLTSHANGAYTSDEKNNRGIFLERLASVYHEQNKLDDAIAAYQKMIDMGGDTALRGYEGQVDVYRDGKMFDKALEVSRNAVAANPKNRDLKLMLAGEMADQGQVDQAMAMAKGLLDKSDSSDNNRIVWLALSQMNIRLRRWKDAEEDLNKADAMSTKKEDRIYLIFLRGELADRQKHFDQAEQFFRQALDLDPSSAITLNYLGYMMADKGVRLPEALSLIQKAVQIEPMNPAYLDSLGWAYFKLGDYELAEQNLRQAVNRDQTDPTIHMHLGDLYEKTGRIRQAAAQWELSLAEFAKSVPADIEPGDVAKVQKMLESARVKLAKQESALGQIKPE